MNLPTRVFVLKCFPLVGSILEDLILVLQIPARAAGSNTLSVSLRQTLSRCTESSRFPELSLVQIPRQYYSRWKLPHFQVDSAYPNVRESKSDRLMQKY